MNTGKTLFAQLMDFLPWTTFTRIVDRYGGDHRVRTLSCAEQYRSMAFAQLTYRESLRDIETCLSVHASKLYHMGFRQPVRRSTRRCQRMAPCSGSHPGEDAVQAGVGPDQYRLRPGLDDHRSVPVGLSVGADHQENTLLDLRGNIPSFIHISDGKLHDVPSICKRHLRTRAKSNIDAHRVYSAPTDRSTGIICDQTISLDGFYTRQDYNFCGAFQGPRVRQDAGLHHQQLLASGRHHLRALQKPLAGGTLLQVDQAASSDQAVPARQNAVKTQIWIAVSVYVLVAIVKKRLGSTLCVFVNRWVRPGA